MRPPLALGTAVCLLLLAACSVPGRDTAADRLTPPRLGSCHDLAPDDLSRPADDADPVPCSKRHTTQTFLVGTLPAFTGSSYDDRRQGRHAYQVCSRALVRFVGGDESMVMRSRLSWAWFRASKKGWERGARWFRCDVVGGPDGATRLDELPTTTKGIFNGRVHDEWMTCATGAAVAGSTKVPCSEPHEWRAVTTIKLGQPGDPYPGDRLTEVRARDYCSDSVGAWMNYPPDYEFGYTWFHEAEWTAGNRRAICWARTAA